jgi:hypothetical protein
MNRVAAIKRERKRTILQCLIHALDDSPSSYDKRADKIAHPRLQNAPRRRYVCQQTDGTLRAP